MRFGVAVSTLKPLDRFCLLIIFLKYYLALYFSQNQVLDHPEILTAIKLRSEIIIQNYCNISFRDSDTNECRWHPDPYFNDGSRCWVKLSHKRVKTYAREKKTRNHQLITKARLFLHMNHSLSAENLEAPYGPTLH